MLSNLSSTSTYLATRFHSMGESIFSEMTELAIKHNAINLGQGAPNFYGPQKLLDAICYHVQTCHNQYAPASGEFALRKQLAQFISHSIGVDYDPNTEILVTCGASEAIFCALNAYLSSGDNVIVFEPAFDLYMQAIANTGANILNVPLIPPTSAQESPNEWVVDWKKLDTVAANGFKCIIINTPNNPTGKVFTCDELKKIGEIAKKNRAIIISDEVYENLFYEKSRPYISITQFSEFRDITIRVSSAAKTFGFTGLKVGWACAPAHLITGLQLVHQSTVFSIYPALQLALKDCLEDKAWLENYLLDQRSSYKIKRNRLLSILQKAGFFVSAAEGTFFLCANYSKISNEPNNVKFAKSFVESKKIAAIPLSPFYLDPPKNFPWVRFAYCKTDETFNALKVNIV